MEREEVEREVKVDEESVLQITLCGKSSSKITQQNRVAVDKEGFEGSFKSCSLLTKWKPLVRVLEIEWQGVSQS